MYTFDFLDARWGLYHLIAHAAMDGHKVSPRGQATHELTHVVATIRRSTTPLALDMNRNINTRLAAAETLQLLGGMADPRWMVAASPRYLSYTGGAMTGAYGPRIAWQMQHVLDALRRDPDTRQAVVQIWSPNDDLLRAHGDRPCTTQITFMIRGGKLITTTYMRSQDIFLGWTYDMVMFSQLHLTMAACLGVQPGDHVHVVQSLHLYERNLDQALAVTRPPDEPAEVLAGLPMQAGDDWSDVTMMARTIAYKNMSESTLSVMPEPRTVTWLRANSTEARSATRA